LDAKTSKESDKLWYFIHEVVLEIDVPQFKLFTNAEKQSLNIKRNRAQRKRTRFIEKISRKLRFLDCPSVDSSVPFHSCTDVAVGYPTPFIFIFRFNGGYTPTIKSSRLLPNINSWVKNVILLVMVCVCTTHEPKRTTGFSSNPN
jgi:hypothetical protein